MRHLSTPTLRELSKELEGLNDKALVALSFTAPDLVVKTTLWLRLTDETDTHVTVHCNLGKANGTFPLDETRVMCDVKQIKAFNKFCDRLNLTPREYVEDQIK